MQVCLLGPPDVVDGAKPVVLGGNKERTVLVVLALRPGEVVSEATLLEALWGDELPRTATKTLQVYVARLRKALGPTAIETRGGGYRLRSGAVELDVSRAEQLLARARGDIKHDQHGNALAALQEAASLWRGSSLGDLAHEPALTGEAARLDELRLAITEERIGVELTLGANATAIPELEALCAAHPLRERLWSLRMLALYRSGRQAEALRTCQDLRRHLAEELGLEPSPEVRDLESAIARHDPAARGDPSVRSEPAVPRGLPSGVITFLLTDVVASTRLWEDHPRAAPDAMARHADLIAEAVASHDGTLLKARGEGDSTFSVFASVTRAVSAALDLQQALLAERWPAGLTVSVRAAINTGEAELRDGDYFGSTVNRCARLLDIGHGSQVLLSQASAELVGERLPDKASLRDLGSHRLRDLARPEHIYQLCHPSLPANFPDLQSLEAHPNNLPFQLTSFIGREREIADVSVLFGGTRLLTLTGAAGCGKTRLGIQVAAEVVEEFPDGVWFVELGPVADASLVTQVVASSLGLREGGASFGLVADQASARPVEDLVREHLRRRHVLIVLDNCEHLVGACAAFADEFLRACPDLRVLATSREPLGVVGETTFRVPSLATPDPVQRQRLADLVEYEAVRLFVDRARLREPGFEVTADVASAVAQICYRLDGIPLALELAAARVKVLSCPEIAARLDDRFRLLTGGSHSALERQQTLRAAIDWSYSLLAPVERTFLERLGVFAGSFGLDAAEAVCSGGEVAAGDVLDLVGQLVDKSLLLNEPRAGHARYRLLETIRQYAREKLFASGEGEETRSRHRDWYVKRGEEAERHFFGPDQFQWFLAVEADLDNFRQALEWSLGAGDAETSLRLAASLSRFWMMIGYQVEGRRAIEQALALPGDVAPFLRARALAVASLLAIQHGDPVASARCEESLALYRMLGVRRGIAWALIALSQIGRYAGRPVETLPLLEEALDVARTSRDKAATGWALLYLGWVAYIMGDYERAETQLLESLKVFADAGEQTGIAAVHSYVIMVMLARGDIAEAARWLGDLEDLFATLGQDADRLFQAVGGDSAGLYTGHARARLAIARGDYAEARRHYEAEIEHLASIGLARGEAGNLALLGLAELSHHDGREDEALGHYRRALGDAVHQNPLYIPDALEGLATLVLDHGNYERAARLLGAADAERERSGRRGSPAEREQIAHAMDQARQALGHDFTAAFERGRVFSREEAVAYALEPDA